MIIKVITDANLWRSQIWKFFFFSDQQPPPPPKKNLFFIWTPYPPPHRAILQEKHRSICRDFNWLNTHPICIGVTKKKLSSFCLPRTTHIMLENKARNHNTSIRSQMILEFWNVWSLNLSFLWATDPTFFYPGFLVSCMRELRRGELA